MPSTVIENFRYRPESRALEITFRSGRRYCYREVPQQTYDEMKKSFSKGEFFNRHIRDRFTFQKLEDS